MWIFGYGSLLWKQNFPYTARRAGVLHGYKRRFWQASADHRGIPGHPGRVTNLLPDPDAQTWGHLFHITGKHADRIGRQLDHREKGGYARHRVTIETFHGPIHNVVTYIGAPDSPYNLGPAPLKQMAWRIATAQGPSGTNWDYLLRLACFLRHHNIHDDHVFNLERAVRHHHTQLARLRK